MMKVSIRAHGGDAAQPTPPKATFGNDVSIRAHGGDAAQLTHLMAKGKAKSQSALMAVTLRSEILDDNEADDVKSQSALMAVTLRSRAFNGVTQKEVSIRAHGGDAAQLCAYW